MNARNLTAIALAPIAAILFTTACGHEEPKLATADLKPLSVAVTEVERITEAHPIEVRGVVHPARQAAVSSRVMGPVVKLNVRAGSTVAKGQVLLEIQPEASAGQLGQSAADLVPFPHDAGQVRLKLRLRHLERRILELLGRRQLTDLVDHQRLKLVCAFRETLAGVLASLHVGAVLVVAVHLPGLLLPVGV